jgi:hypothetical protein
MKSYKKGFDDGLTVGFDAGRKFMKLVMEKEHKLELENMEKLMRFWRNEARLLRMERDFEIIDLGEVNYE